jgi:GT2 family glycosyltransferase
VTDGAAKVLGVPDPALSVVICTLGAPRVSETVASVAESARAAGSEVEQVVVWQSRSSAPDLAGARRLDVFPAGLAYARNRGLLAARAPLVAFVDDDEVVDPKWVGAVVEAFGHSEAPAAVFGPVAPRDDRGLPYCRYDGGGSFKVVRPGTPPWRIGTGGNMAFRRDALLAVGGFDPLFGLGSVSRSAEETELIQRLLDSGRSLAWSPHIVVYHPTKTEAERLRSRFPYAYGLGKLMRRHRSPVLAARYGSEIARALASGARARDRRRLRETAATARGFATALAFRARPRSPELVSERAPGPVAAALDGERPEPCEPSYRPDPHFLYRVGADRLLHVYVNPTARLRAGLAVRAGLTAPGIPKVFAQADDVDALWVLEEYLPGTPPRPERVEEWFGPLAEWSLELGAASGKPVREGSWWADEATAAVAVADGPLREAVEGALEVVGELPSRAIHGDFQPKNVLVRDDGSLGVIDWEDAYDDGPPGLDLLFLAAMARSGRPDAQVLRDLAGGLDPGWAPLRALVLRAGVDGAVLGSLLLVVLAAWAADEGAARTAAPGMPRAEPLFGRLLHELGPELAEPVP